MPANHPPQPDRQRQFAVAVVRKLRDAGYEALWAGGCVRDHLLGLVPKDYDVATDATPDDIRRLFGYRRTVPVGAAFGVMTVLGRRREGQIEVATFRSDARYSDGRHPDSVTFTNAEHDAQRRDFTINGLFFDPLAGQVIDYVGGEADLAAGLIRAIGDPHERIAEDRLRMLRAVRFAATFQFAVEPETMAAIQHTAHQVTEVSAERIGMELTRILTGDGRGRALNLLDESWLLAAVLPEVAELSPEELRESQQVLDELAAPTLATALAVLLSRRGGAGPVGDICRRLRLTNKTRERTAWLLENLLVVARAPDVPWPGLQRVLVHPGIGELMALLAATCGKDRSALEFCRERLAQPPAELNPPPLVDGAALIEHGLQPGPEFSELLERVRDAQLLHQVTTREEALALVDRLRTAGLDA